MSEAIELGSNATRVPPICRLKCVYNKVINKYISFHLIRVTISLNRVFIYHFIETFFLRFEVKVFYVFFLYKGLCNNYLEGGWETKGGGGHRGKSQLERGGWM